MEDYITLNELYIYNPKFFKGKNLKSFIRNLKVPENDIVKVGSAKSNKLGITKAWVKKNIPSFNLKLTEMSDEIAADFFEAMSTLEKYNCKTFNPVSLNLDSTLVHYFVKQDKRTPFFTRKGLFKIMTHFNSMPEYIFDWIHELLNGRLQPHANNLANVAEMINLAHPPIIKRNGDNTPVLSNHFYNINKKDVVVDFKRVGDLKKESDLKSVIEEYKCPVYSQLQSNFERDLEEAERSFENRLKELKQEKVIQHLQLELDKEKSLHQLTQSFMPKISESPQTKDDVGSLNLGKLLKPSKIQ